MSYRTLLRRSGKSTPALIVLIASIIVSSTLIWEAHSASYSFVSPRWIETTGAGFSAPACASASAGSSCSGGSGSITLSWDCGEHGDTNAGIIINGSVVAHPLPPTGSYTVSDLSSNTTYSWRIGCAPVTSVSDWPSGSATTPNCGGGSPPPPPPPPPGYSQGGYTPPSPGYSYGQGYYYGYGQSYYYGQAAYPPVSVDINASPNPVVFGNPTNLSWTSQHAITCSASSDWSGVKPTSGSEVTGGLTANSTFNINCTGLGAPGSDSVSVTVLPAVNLNLTPALITSGSNSELVWSTGGATSCTASANPPSSQWSGPVALSGSRTVSPSTTTDFILTCTGPGGQNSGIATLNTGIVEEIEP